ncbi:NAD(P)-dependent dehydrogenase (short-subunit alcohol dehydrogenase family) [Lewinella aquimaris]|uniref:NAD(P)-dependent dehydrogenase (Short-subunit alcohol dehydrogenase family) n=1 Tax=Neolewinella aquimaris TaxID=1835722 RepID=A0A840E8D1_9BACT|nr:SDR family oxidoreductase [Neolewinella aquimaris]MBB4078328.1 NAD(P)-dependent dehydrogenase (short-subunit alcohol dehydrogenase family) [Neolewinella aquimaris]
MKIAVVTGANRGLGLEVVRQLAKLGYRVLLTSRTESGAGIARELQGQGMDVAYHQLDVADGQSIGEFAQFLRERHPVIDVLINNAGIHYDRHQTTLTADFSIVNEAWQVNTLGPWRLSKALYPLLRKGGGGRIVNVSSASGTIADSWPGTPAYAVTKAALNMLTVKLAADVAEEKILVNAVCPGWVQTDMGGPDAPRTVAQGAASIVWAAEIDDDGPTGGFFRDGAPLPW